MPVHPVRLFGDPVLRTAADPVTSFDDRLARAPDSLVGVPDGVDLRVAGVVADAVPSGDGGDHNMQETQPSTSVPSSASWRMRE